MIVNHRPGRNGRAVAAPSVIANDGGDDRVVGRARPVHRMIDDRVVARSRSVHWACAQGAATASAVVVAIMMTAAAVRKSRDTARRNKGRHRASDEEML